MPRKLAALIATAAAAVIVTGTLTAVALGNHSSSASPRPTVVSLSAPPSTVVATTPARPAVRTPAPVLGSYGPMAGGKVVYLTFDDGPDPAWTPQVLSVLAKYGAKATFFQLGGMVTAHPGLQAQVRAAGHTIGNHSVTHPVLTAISPARRHQEIVGGPASHCFRPPYGATNPKVAADIKAAGMAQILWTIDPRDWDLPGTGAIVWNVLHHAYPGGIVLLHDGGGNRAQTVAALDRILHVLTARGYSFPALTC